MTYRYRILVSCSKFYNSRLEVGSKDHTRVRGSLLLHVRQKRSMPPKKRGASESEDPGPLLGRFGTSLKCGIVGLPNVGCVLYLCSYSDY